MLAGSPVAAVGLIVVAIALGVLATQPGRAQPRPSEHSLNNQGAHTNQSPADPSASIAEIVAAYDKGYRDAQRGEPFYEGDNFWVATFTGLLFVSTILLWMATERTVRHAERSSKRELRAYLYVMSNETPKFDGEGLLEGHFLLKNAGQTPALKVRTANAMSIGKLPFEGDPPPIDESIFEGGAPLAPGAVFRLICRIPESPPENWRDALKKRTRAVCMYGEIRYLDVFGEEHITTYRAMYSGPIAEGVDEIIWCQNGNEAT